MVGQINLLNKISKLSLDNFSHSNLILGEEGSGKHLIAKKISEHLKLEYLDITKLIDSDFINSIYINPLSFLYVVDLKEITEKDQNILLKLVEEPPINSYIILIGRSIINILPTILNRCNIFNIADYSRDELSQFTDNEIAINCLKTPGRIINSNLDTLKDIKDVCKNILNILKNDNLATLLTIINKINYKDDYDKFDINNFLDILINTLFNYWINNNDKNIYKIYILTINQRKVLLDNRINKQIFMENYLIKLWNVSHNEN